jgi:UDP-glucose:(heptosyl)LPS alpha-1,3-glucosyltransferase
MTKRLRIAVLTRNFVSTGGGAERYAIAIVKGLAPRHDIHVFSQTADRALDGVTYHRVPYPLSRSRWMNQVYFAAATWWATRQGFDIVHSHENTWHGNVQTVHVLPIKHNLFFDKHGAYRLMRWLKVLTSPRLIAYLWLEGKRYDMHGGRRVVLTSNSLRGVMLHSYPQTQAVLEVVPPGVASVPGLATDAQRAVARAGLGLPLKGICLLFVGNDCRKKGLPALIRALRLMPADTCVAVVSNSSQLDDLRQEARERGMEKRVHFLGALADMSTAYIAADLLAHPTLEDTFAMVVLEAMSHGLPVVVSGPQFCGIAGDLHHGRDAMLVKNPRDEQELSDHIMTVLSDPQLAGALSAGGVQFANRLSWETAAIRYEQIYGEVAAGVAGVKSLNGIP